MNKLENLAMQHRLLDDQIDELEKSSHHPLPQEIKMIADLKKDRLKIKDMMEQVKNQLEAMDGQ
jgi:uncharacterized protein YdcH (DUF465 family)